MSLTLFPTLDGLHVSCFSCPGRRVTHTFTFYVPDIGKSPTRPVPKWLFFPSLAKKNIVDPSQKFFLTAGSMAAVLVFGMPSHLLFVTRKKENRGFSVSLPFALCYCGRRFFFYRLLLFHMFCGKNKQHQRAFLEDEYSRMSCPYFWNTLIS